MASPESSSVEDILQAIKEHGFFVRKDAIIGQRIEELENAGTLFASAGGLRFCKDNVLENSCIRPILDTFFDWFALGLYRSYSAAPGDYFYQLHHPIADGQSLLVHLWRKGSKVSYWGRSHRHQLPYVKGDNNLWRVPRIALTNHELEPIDFTFEQGGFAIVDPRVILTIREGNAITFAFGTKDALSLGWNPMELPKSQHIEEIVALMESTNFGMNVKYDSKGKD